MSDQPHHCRGCPARWGGSLTCHCSRCHLTFSGVSGFDFHQAGERCRSKRELWSHAYRYVRPGVIGRPTPDGDPTTTHQEDQ